MNVEIRRRQSLNVPGIEKQNTQDWNVFPLSFLASLTKRLSYGRQQLSELVLDRLEPILVQALLFQQPQKPRNWQ